MNRNTNGQLMQRKMSGCVSHSLEQSFQEVACARTFCVLLALLSVWQREEEYQRLLAAQRRQLLEERRRKMMEEDSNAPAPAEELNDTEGAEAV